jgi:nickel-dependent lactate racemase
MRVTVRFQSEGLELDIPKERLVAEWHGPAGMAASEVYGRVCAALDNPIQFPPLCKTVVPGDQVVIALDSEVPVAASIVEAVTDTVVQAGVSAASITVLCSAASRPVPKLDRLVQSGVSLAVHDPGDRTRIAYLASTAEGRRVYLSRLLTDADVVVPVARLGYDPVLGYRGPWGLLFPGLSDAETTRAFGGVPLVDWPDPDRPCAALVESAEVAWLLGCQFHVGILAGAPGPVEILAGLESSIRHEGTRAVDRSWSFEVESRAELVLVGIGQPDLPSEIEHLSRALAMAARLVVHGGKIVALSRVEGPIGPAVGHLLTIEDPRSAGAALRGLESAPDYAVARQLAGVLPWADVYLLSALATDPFEDSPIVTLDQPEEARRLVAASRSCIVLSHADYARVRVAGETH